MTDTYKRLYYYTAKQWGMKVLWEGRLKIAQYSEVNDPFELIPFDLTKEKSREFWDKQVNRLLSSRFGIICFSEDWRTTLMWSHYGEKHTGMCLGFDVRSDCIEPITYIDHLHKDPIDHKQELRGLSAQVLEDALRCKYAGWSYEREWRYRVPLLAPIDSVYYKEFGDDIYLREVIIGPRCSMSTGDVEDAIRNNPLDVEIFKARAAFGKFEVCRRERGASRFEPHWAWNSGAGSVRDGRGDAGPWTAEIPSGWPHNTPPCGSPGLFSGSRDHGLPRASLDPRIASQDPRVRSLDPRVALFDPRIAVRDPRIASRDPAFALLDPRGAYRNSPIA